MSSVKDLQKMLALGRISRREFLQAVTAVGVSAAVGPHLMSEAFAATPKQGGHLRCGLEGGATSDSLDGATWTDAFMQMLGTGVTFDCLTEVAPDGSLRGELCESWEAGPEAKTWTFKLKQGVTFHNGKDFVADDVIESLQHHLGEDSTSAAKPIVDNIAEMKKDGDHVIVFELKNGNADFPFLLSDYHLVIYPGGMLDEAIAKGIGTGGYILESFEPGVRSVSRKNPNDHRSDRCFFDSVEIVGIADISARMNALMTGEVEAINRVDLKTEHLLKRNKNINIFEVTGNQHFTFPMITTQDPYTDNNVRLALKHAINRVELVEKILKGHGMVGNDHPIGPANQYWAKDMEQRTYDPDKAKFYLKEAGLDTLSVSLSAADAAFPGAVDAAVLFKESAAAAGINIEVVREPNDGYWSNVWLKKPFCACYWAGRPTEDWMFSSTYERGVPWNDTFWDHEQFNELLIQARVELDTDKRRQIYHDMQRIVRDEGGTIIPMFANYVDAASTKLAQPEQISNTWQMDGLRLPERWWFA